MKRGAWLANTARAEIVNEVALIGPLDFGQLGGGALDVFWSEPLDQKNALLRRTDVVLSPHVARSTTRGQADNKRMLAKRIAIWADEHWFVKRRDEA